MVRCGIGIDVHPFARNRQLILGGVVFDSELGLLGHSDADVVCHAIADALLGAAGLGDIGQHFPHTDSKYEGISSLDLLGLVARMLVSAGFGIGNVDVSVVTQHPQIAPRAAEMAANIASALHIKQEVVNIKGKTTEKLGFVGREEGIAAIAVATVTKGDK